MLKLYFLHTIHQNLTSYLTSNSIHENMDGLLNTLKFVHEISVDIMKFVVAVQNWFVSCENFSIIDFLL
jgi:hypothetical protein